MGLRKISKPECTDGGSCGGEERDHLIVVFELEPESEEETAAQFVSIDGKIGITSQEELDEYIEAQKALADVHFGRKFLRLLSAFNAE